MHVQFKLILEKLFNKFQRVLVLYLMRISVIGVVTGVGMNTIHQRNVELLAYTEMRMDGGGWWKFFVMLS